MKKHRLLLLALVVPTTIGALGLLSAAGPTGLEDDGEIQLGLANIYWEYNATDNDLGVHVTLDGEDWRTMRIFNPNDKLLFDVRGKGPYKELGMTELFFEGAEPSLEDVPLEDLLGLFPAGVYEFEGLTVDNEEIEGEASFSHAIPDGPEVFAVVGVNDLLRIEWNPVTAPPPGFPELPLVITGYQVIVESFQVTVPAHVNAVTVPPEFVGTLRAGEHEYEVLAIEASGNQTLTSDTFVLR